MQLVRIMAFVLLTIDWVNIAWSQDITVYIAETGSKYHYSTCRYVSESKIPISLSTACAQGYTPCSICDPPNCSLLPIELISFEFKVYKDGFILNWSTASELNNYGFEILKTKDKENWEKIGFVAGNGTTTQTKTYSYESDLIKADNYYQLKQIDYSGNYKLSKILFIENPTFNSCIQSFHLEQNYPNPFNANTIIQYSIFVNANIKISIVDILGREIKILLNEELNPGNYNVEYNSKNIETGLYFCRIEDIKGNREYIKMVLIK